MIENVITLQVSCEYDLSVENQFEKKTFKTLWVTTCKSTIPPWKIFQIWVKCQRQEIIKMILETL